MQKTLLTFCLVAAAQVPAQIHIPSDTPAVGTCNVFPFGRTSAVYQCLATQAQLGGATVLTIRDMAFTPCGNYSMKFTDLEIKIAQTDATTLNANFATNLKSNVRTVLQASSYDWNPQQNTWNTIGLESDYTYVATGDNNVVVQITFTNLTGGGSFHRDVMPRAYALNWTGAPPTSGTVNNGALKWEFVTDRGGLFNYGVGCPGSSGNAPALALTGSSAQGSAFAVELSNAPASAAALLSVNTRRLSPWFDLGLAGAPGCRLYVPDLAILALTTNTNGAGAMKFAIPNSVPIGTQVQMQAFPLDPRANSLGLSASNGGRIVVE